MAEADVGVIGGSGLQALAAHEPLREVHLETPWGEPSGPYSLGTVAGREVAFLARHGRGHQLLPSEINYRANVWGFRELGVTRLLSASAVGSLREDIAPLDVVIVDQFIDRTVHRPATFFGEGLVAHVSLADPTCSQLRPLAAAAARSAGARVHEAGTYLCMEGPQFSTRAESRLYRTWGADVIGMTNLTEARLAREAELCYATFALVTDYDCWREGEEAVSVDLLLGHLRRNAELASTALRALVESLPAERDCACGRALAHAVITEPSAVPPATAGRLGSLAARYLG